MRYITGQRKVQSFILCMRIIPEKSDMLQHWMFSQIYEDRDVRIFIQDGAPPHFHHEVRQYLDDTSPGRWMGRSGQRDLVHLKWPQR
ncbi:hypothetical protein AVEN_108150-1 [Araneus ventricosus]|uniref:Tc1-like transposase DDE domain-containing protein n=1 Tax=Araneus ventricosus TaxID=182803 RepID=A0A4Y2UKZ5_ARAVE|nr:hypothetical protein AVEN_234934-1 [Araneus ventricosus]GBO12874.1 hypothetical protein AVEN_108150-1 [Araneus ventricosus]